jgi:hypothetical protein
MRRDDSPGDDIKDLAANKLANAGTLMQRGKKRHAKRTGRKRGKKRGA